MTSGQNRNNSSDWILGEVQDIFERTLALSPDKRAAFIKYACGGRRSLEKEVLSLLKAHWAAPEFLSKPAVEDAKRALERKAMQLAQGANGFHPKALGKYTLLRRMGVGGMAEIFHAVISGDCGFEKQVAIKSILSSLTSESILRELFAKEAKINSVLTHSNIAQVYDFFQEKDNYFLAMEFVDGRNLRQILDKVGSELPSRPLACHVVSQVAKGIGYAHSLGIIHRDISPKNVMVSYDGEVKVVDFGIAKAKEQALQTLSVTLKGTFRYMSPEQALRKELDPRCDIFSLGLVLYELLTGRSLFQETELIGILEEVRNFKSVDPYLEGKGLPSELRKILQKALAADIEDRYPKADDLHRDLHVFLSRESSNSGYLEISSWMKSLFREEIRKDRAEIADVLEFLPSNFNDSHFLLPLTAPPTAFRSEQPSPAPKKGEKHLHVSLLGFFGLVTLTVVFTFGFLASRSFQSNAVVVQKLEALPIHVPPETPADVSVPSPSPDVAPSRPPLRAVEIKKKVRGTASRSSGPVEWSLALIAPSNHHQFTESDDSPPITFSWKVNYSAKSKGVMFVLEISDSPSFTHLVARRETTETIYADTSLKLEPGDYYWRVLLAKPSGQVIIRAEQFHFSYLGSPPPMAPTSTVRIKEKKSK